jgi:translation elongation factor EF-Tu-like GTPase
MGMARRLIVVEDRFVIKGRGVVVLPGIVPEEDERIRVGDQVEIRRPDGSLLGWSIGGIEIFSTPMARPRESWDYPILLIGLEKDDVPVGSEIWSVDQ